MNFKKVASVYKKGLLETLRDKRTLIFAILVPLLLYPVLLIGMNQLMSLGQAKLESKVSRVAVEESINQKLVRLLQDESKLKLVQVQNLNKSLKEGSIQAYLSSKLKGDQEQITIHYDGAVEESGQAKGRIREVIDKYKKARQQKALQEAGVSKTILDIVTVAANNEAPPEKMGGKMLGYIIPILIIVSVALGATYPAIDLTAGEKERGTLETVFTLPVEKVELLFGKYFTVTTVAVITGILNLTSVMLVYSLGMVQMKELVGNVEITISIGAILLLFVLLLPLVFFISAVVLSVSTMAKSFKEAQNFISPVYILLILPAYVGMMPGIEMNSMLAMIPITNISLLFKDILVQNYNFNFIFLAFTSNLLYSFFAVFAFSKVFTSENVLFAEEEGYNFSLNRDNIRSKQVLDVLNAVFLYAVVMFLLIYAGTFLQLKFKLWGVFLTEWIVILLPVLVVIWYLKADFRASLQLKKCKLSSLLGGLLIWSGTYVFVQYVTNIQAKFFPGQEIFGKEMINLMDGANFWVAVLVIGLSPAICEEILFRGALLSALKKKFNLWSSILIVGLLFGLFHLAIFRILPSALLGIAFSYVAYQSGSIIPGMVLHFINNTFSVLMVYYPQKLPQFVSKIFNISEFSPLLFISAVGIIILGSYLVKGQFSQ